ncbi:MAG: ferredoxin family protein [Anaerolineales bacterium]|nr:ferredoxin family protein [Anaerolineales bacterium]
MSSIITRLCLRNGSCAEVCPVEAIIAGKPVEQWPWYYIDAESCIDCGACIPECPHEAIYEEGEVPSNYVAKGGEITSMPAGTPGYDQVYDGTNHDGEAVHLEHTRKLEAGEELDLSEDVQANIDFFSNGPGYDA